MIMVVEGHSIEGVDVQESAYYSTPDQGRAMPAMRHGTSQQAVASILYSCLSRAGRQSVMFFIFPFGAGGSVKDSGPTIMNPQRLCSWTRTWQ